MIEAVLSLPAPVGALIAMGLTTAAGLATYLVSYVLVKRFRTEETNEEVREASINLFQVVGVLVSLLLSLTMADVLLELDAIERAIEAEAVAISDTYYDLQRFGAQETAGIQTLLIDYAEAVIDDDWPALEEDRLGERAGALLRRLSDAALTLEPANDRERTLRDRIIGQVDLISDYRLSRLQQALAKPPFFLIISLFAFLVTMAYFGLYRPAGVLIALVSLYTLLVGLVLYVTLAFSDPFEGVPGVNAAPLEAVLERMQAPTG